LGSQGLGVTDRMALTTSKFVLTNQYTRAFAFFYMVALHLLVPTHSFPSDTRARREERVVLMRGGTRDGR
jgi:hypothetical protein